ncbi:hypothetical protein BY996DRAFT_6469010 [Phakopsora pachyrhizi]|uniref:PITH domain-containing protein n=1 Tax=Phakopsora pachyrhizi TaxID=170000 RepID=A0AAV0BAJ4_PHAPC|nr:hypothetical protein BY996DRAFT_6469010 [Phakopsora pachyrhizi]CAH7684190.1 hypothetical protein PPACK8108_LOCUS18240 [Phakopsora pachyrhizi]
MATDWEPEPLEEPIPIPDVRPKILFGEPALRFTKSLEDECTINLKGIRTVTNLASIKFTGLIGKAKLGAVRSTWSDSFDSIVIFFIIPDVHMELERDIAQFIGLPSSKIYAQDFSTTSSVIPNSNAKKIITILIQHSTRK